MKIVIPDDYQGVVPSLRCFATLAGHEVVTTRGPTPDLDTLARDLADAEIVVLVRERVPMPRALIERLPKLRLISQAGRSTNHVDPRGRAASAASPSPPARMARRPRPPSSPSH